MASVKYRKRSGRWQIRFRTTGKEKTIVLNGNLTERQVKTIAIERELAWLNGTYNPFTDPSFTIIDPSLTDTLESVLSEYIKYKDSIWSDTSHYNKSNCLLNFCDTIGLTSSITRLNQTKIDEYLKVNKGLSDKTLSGYVATINAFLKWIFAKAYIKQEFKLSFRAKKKTTFPDILTESELLHLVNHTYSQVVQKKSNAPKSTNKTHYTDYFLVYFYTGLRTDELPHIKVSDISFENKLMMVGKNKISKDKEERAVYLVPQVIPIIKKMVVGKSKSDWLTVNRSMQSISKEFTRIRRELFPHKNVTLINLRHSCGCWLLEQGISLDAIASQFGHADTRTTKIYAQMTNKALKNEFERIIK